MKRLHPWVLWALLIALCVAGFGCNTIRGAGMTESVPAHDARTNDSLSDGLSPEYSGLPTSVVNLSGSAPIPR
jgi:predicted small secreted protein